MYMLKLLWQIQLLCVQWSQFSDFNTSFFLSTLSYAPRLKNIFWKPHFHILRTQKKCQILFFPFAVLELQKQPKGSFIKYVKICAESWGFICQELDCGEFLLQLILTPRERKLAGDPGPLSHGEHHNTFLQIILLCRRTNSWLSTIGQSRVPSTLCFFFFSVKAFWPFHSSLAPPPEGRWWQGEEVKLKLVNFTAR